VWTLASSPCYGAAFLLASFRFVHHNARRFAKALGIADKGRKVFVLKAKMFGKRNQNRRRRAAYRALGLLFELKLMLPE